MNENWLPFPSTFPSGGKSDGKDIIRKKVGRDMRTGQRDQMCTSCLQLESWKVGWSLNPETIKTTEAISVILTCHRNVTIIANNTYAPEGATGVATSVPSCIASLLKTHGSMHGWNKDGISPPCKYLELLNSTKT